MINVADDNEQKLLTSLPYLHHSRYVILKKDIHSQWTQEVFSCSWIRYHWWRGTFEEDDTAEVLHASPLP